MYQKVTNDLFDIATRLKRINKEYRVFWNNRNLRYEVHGGNARTPSGWTLAFIVPGRLDARVLEYANRTRRQNDTQIEREIESANLKAQQKVFDDLTAKQHDLESMLEYANRANHRVDFTKNFTKEF